MVQVLLCRQFLSSDPHLQEFSADQFHVADEKFNIVFQMQQFCLPAVAMLLSSAGEGRSQPLPDISVQSAVLLIGDAFKVPSPFQAFLPDIPAGPVGNQKVIEFSSQHRVQSSAPLFETEGALLSRQCFDIIFELLE